MPFCLRLPKGGDMKLIDEHGGVLPAGAVTSIATVTDEAAVRSNAIKVARVLCIFFVMFVHVYTGYPADLPILTRFDASDIYYHLFMDVLGRSSVPLLTIISGWLFYQSRKRGFFQLLSSKVKSLIVPMVLWNFGALALIISYAFITHKFQDIPANTLSWTNAILAITHQPINLPLGFLRDLFVVFLITPFIIPLVKKGGIIAIILIAALAIAWPSSFILLRTQILLFFSLGLFLADQNFWRLPKGSFIGSILFIVAIFSWKMTLLEEGESAINSPFLEILLRLSVSIFVWRIAIFSSEKNFRFLIQLEQFSFIAFCSHFIFFRALSVIGVNIFGDLSSPIYPIYFTIQPILGFAVAIVIVTTLSRISPPLLGVLNAGKRSVRF